MLRNKVVKTFLFSFILLAFFSIVAVAIINIIVWASVRGKVVDFAEEIALDNDFDCVLVLGAGVRADGSPSAMLADRLDVGIHLYFANASNRILMSGDHMSADYDEVGTMKKYAVESGVPSEVIFLDHAGLSTYESLWRAREIFGGEKILIVTQEYHLYRSLYVAKVLGLDAYGVSADLRPYRGQVFRELREIMARVKDFFFAHFEPEPTYLGEEVDLAGDGDSTNVNKLFQ